MGYNLCLDKASVPLIEIRNLSVRFGNIVALNSVSFDIPCGSTFGLIGPNGAGKTTLFNCLSRVVPFQQGEIYMSGAPLSTCRAHDMPSIGIARTFQNLAMFGTMSVIENVLVGAHSRLTAGVIDSALGFSRVRQEEQRARSDAEELAHYLDLWSVRNQVINDLPFGTQKRVELARALMQRPRLLLLDEPAAGLTHAEVDELGAQISALKSKFALSVLLVEHHMGLVMGISDHMAVLNFGNLIAAGNPAAVSKQQAVIDAYLGVS